LEPQRAPTLVLVNEVHAGVIGVAGDPSTVVDVDAAVLPLEPENTVAVVVRTPLVPQLVTRRVILTWLCSARVVQRFAIYAHVPAGTVAGVRVDAVHAGPPVEAGEATALVNIDLASRTRVAGKAGT